LLLKEKKCLKNVKNSFPIFFQRQVHSPKPLNIFYTCCVNQELASMHDMLKQQRARNESLKKIQQVKTNLVNMITYLSKYVTNIFNRWYICMCRLLSHKRMMSPPRFCCLTLTYPLITTLWNQLIYNQPQHSHQTWIFFCQLHTFKTTL